MDCVLHLIALKSDLSPAGFLAHFDNKSYGSPPYLLKARAHGWVHRPHHLNKDQLLGHKWDLFLLTEKSALPKATDDLISARIWLGVSFPEFQHEKIKSQFGSVPEPVPETPLLPKEWPKTGGIPSSAIVETKGPLNPGELRLDPAMEEFLSNALPSDVANTPVSFMNLFKYPGGDSSTHDSYMESFKNNFGNAAGASIKFMGPAKGELKFESESLDKGVEEGGRWNDANLVQYDSIWHYAYMLSTDVYQELNKEKMAGLEDTCILCVSEVELAR